MKRKALPLLLLVLLFGSSAPAQSDAKKKPKKQPAPFAWSNPMGAAGLEKYGLPKGLSHKTFKSPSMGLDVGYFIYLPEGYKASGNREYPVVFDIPRRRPPTGKKSGKIYKFDHPARKTGAIAHTPSFFISTADAPDRRRSRSRFPSFPTRRSKRGQSNPPFTSFLMAAQ
ncbi:MAG: hypothetical protein P1U86_07805 [Verrucomicrobiales bacterium]|nr:hypothetical protein [Verrucomicrobiales bacterium]